MIQEKRRGGTWERETEPTFLLTKGKKSWKFKQINMTRKR